MPIAAVAAVVTPEIAPNIAANPSEVSGMLPRNPPIIEATQRIRRVEMPPRDIRSPAKMKNGTASSGYLLRLLKMIWWIAVSGTGKKTIITTNEVASSSRKIGKAQQQQTERKQRHRQVHDRRSAYPNVPLR